MASWWERSVRRADWMRGMVATQWRVVQAFNPKASVAAKGQRGLSKLNLAHTTSSCSHQRALWMFQIGWQRATWCSCVPNMVAKLQQATSHLSLIPRKGFASWSPYSAGSMPAMTLSALVRSRMFTTTFRVASTGDWRQTYSAV